MNPLSSKQIERLERSIEWSNRQMAFPRRKRLENIHRFTGSHYAEGGSDKPVPVNFAKMAVDVYGRTLSPPAPRAMMATKQAELKPTAANLELAVNQIPKEIGLAMVLRKLVTEALFSTGILKVGLHTVSQAMGQPYGESFVDLVTLDDYFVDMSAKEISKIQYEGNMYWLNFDNVMESDWIKKKARNGLKPDEHTVIGPNGENRAEGVSTQESADVFKERIWLRDIWLPDERLLVTMGVRSKKVLNIVEWDGPEEGPYPKLGFADVPGNLLPLPPMAIWSDLHDLGNALFRKLGNQADSEKSVLGFLGGNEESVEEFKKASDGDGITYNGQDPKRLVAGGVNGKTLAFYLQVRDLSSYFAGNLDSLGGLGTMAETATQDKLLSEAASAQLRDMSTRVVELVRKVFRALAYYEWHDPVKRRILEKPIPGSDIVIPVPWGRESKIGDFSLYDLDIDVYSLQDNSPGLKLQKLGAIVQNYILPLAPLIQQAGGNIDVQRLLEIIARYSDMQEVGEIVTFMEQTPTPSAAVAESGMPANTTRTYEQVGRPGMSREGASAVTQQLLLGKDAQDSEVAQT